MRRHGAERVRRHVLRRCPRPAPAHGRAAGADGQPRSVGGPTGRVPVHRHRQLGGPHRSVGRRLAAGRRSDRPARSGRRRVAVGARRPPRPPRRARRRHLGVDGWPRAVRGGPGSSGPRRGRRAGAGQLADPPGPAHLPARDVRDDRAPGRRRLPHDDVAVALRPDPGAHRPSRAALRRAQPRDPRGSGARRRGHRRVVRERHDRRRARGRLTQKASGHENERFPARCRDQKRSGRVLRWRRPLPARDQRRSPPPRVLNPDVGWPARSGQTRCMSAPARSRSLPGIHGRRSAIVALSAAMLAWGTTGVAAKAVDMGGMALAAYRSSVGAVVLVSLVYLSGRRLTWAKVRMGIPGGVFLGLDLILFFSAVKLTTVANSTVIGALQPALVLLISGPLLGEKVVRGAARWAVVGLAGSALVVFGASGLPDWSAQGDSIAVLALLAWTAYFVATRLIRNRMEALEYAAVTAIVASLVAWPAAALF